MVINEVYPKDIFELRGKKLGKILKGSKKSNESALGFM